MLGDSRGGMMTYLALKRDVPVRAAVVVGCETDLAANAARRPELFRNYLERIPEFEMFGHRLLQERSAQAWPEQIGVLVLLLNGGADWRVPTVSALDFAKALERAGKAYQLTIFAQNDHLVSFRLPGSGSTCTDLPRTRISDPFWGRILSMKPVRDIIQRPAWLRLCLVILTALPLPEVVLAQTAERTTTSLAFRGDREHLR